MRKMPMGGIAALVFSCLPQAVLADEADFIGDWMVELTDDDRTLVGRLDIERRDGNIVAFLEGGPLRIEIDGNRITLWADSRDVRGFVFDRRMTGELSAGLIEGRYTQEGAAAQVEDGGPWRAEPVPAENVSPASPDPVDLSGTWTATQELDFRKYTMALTEAGKAWLDEYLPYYDQPDVRCASIGLPALATYSFPFEIIASEDRLTFIYEYQSRVRRIWLDGRQPSDYMPPSRMGHSNGHWEGNTLVVETTLLERTVRDFRGELISENATIEERYTPGDDGETLSAVITVFDPENYERPPVRRRMWKKNDAAEIFPYTCDPDSFYITMYEEGEFDMYIERADRRF
jgi:hypothetical protein